MAAYGMQAATAPLIATGERQDYPLAFWCLVFFTFIVFVAPQNAYEALVPLHLAKVSAILALVTYGVQALSRRQSLLPSGPEFRLLGLLVVIAALSIPFSLWPGGSVDVMTEYFLKSVIICVLMAKLLTSLKRVKQMLWAMVCFCAIAAMVAFSGYHKPVEGYRMGGGWAGITGNPNDFALTLNIMLPFAVAFFMLSRNPVGKAVMAGFLGTTVVAILSTYSRTGFLTLAVVLLLAFVKHVGQGQGLKYILPAALIVLTAVNFVPQDYETRLESIVETSKDKVGSSSARLAGIRTALEVIQEHPVTGVGLGMNILALNNKGLYWAHVHNVYLQIAAEIGIAGLVVFLLLLRRLLKGLRQGQARMKRDPARQEVVLLTAACEISLLAFAVAAFFHPVAYHFYFYYLAGFAIALQRIGEAPPEPAERPAAPRGWVYQAPQPVRVGS